jgi:hypothetical protein
MDLKQQLIENTSPELVIDTDQITDDQVIETDDKLGKIWEVRSSGRERKQVAVSFSSGKVIVAMEGANKILEDKVSLRLSPKRVEIILSNGAVNVIQEDA